jgi:hypothetical protein
MESLQRYHEVTWEGHRTFELFEDRVVVDVTRPSYQARATVRVADLRPDADIMFLRPLPGRLGMIGIAIGTLTTMFAATVLRGDLRYFGMIGSGSLILLSVIVAGCFARKVEYAFFKNHSGVTLLTIALSGPDKARYREFISSLTDLIKSSCNQ